METERKLKRGLAELSRFFSGNGSFPFEEARASLPIIQKPNGAAIPPSVDGDRRLPRLICTTFLYSPEIFQPIDFFYLLDHMKIEFEEVFLLSVTDHPWDAQKDIQPLVHRSNGNRFERFDIRLRKVEDRIVFGQMSCTQLGRIIQPRAASHLDHEFSASRRALVIFDSVFQGHQVSNLTQASRELLRLLDHCVFVVPIELEHLMRTYELIRECLTQNPTLRCSIFIVGRGAQALWEFAFERFNSIVSEFLGCDLGFLGWMKDQHVRLNLEPLLEEGDHMIQKSSKIRLREALYPSGARCSEPVLVT